MRRLTALLAHPIVAVLRRNLVALSQSGLTIDDQMEVPTILNQIENIHYFLASHLHRHLGIVMHFEIMRHIDHELIWDKPDQIRCERHIKNSWYFIIAARYILHQVVKHKRALRKFEQDVIDLGIAYVFVRLARFLRKATGEEYYFLAQLREVFENIHAVWLIPRTALHSGFWDHIHHLQA